MNSRKLFHSIGEIEDRFIDEASPKEKMQPTKRRFSVIKAAVAAAIILVTAVPITAFAIETFQYNAAVTYLTSLGIEAEDLSDYSRREVIDTVKTYDAGESNALIENLLQENDKIPVTDTMAQVTSEQVSKLTPTMTYKDIIEVLGNTVDVGSGIYILQYEVDGEYTIKIPLADDNAQLGVTGDKLLEAEKSVTVLQADYPKYNTAEELVESSDLVFTGTVKNIEYQMIDVSTDKEPDEDTGFVDDEKMPYTLYTVDVDKIYKGSIESSTIIIKRAGGSFGSDEYVVENASEIAKGKKYLFVTETYEDTYPSLLNADQSSYDMDTPQTIMDGEEKEITLSDILKLF